jgi:hypothetical protein
MAVALRLFSPKRVTIVLSHPPIRSSVRIAKSDSAAPEASFPLAAYAIAERVRYAWEAGAASVFGTYPVRAMREATPSGSRAAFS